jgi:TPR repeat protein
MNNLANLYEAGTDVPYDHAESISLWRQSSTRGDPNAMYNIGNLLVKERKGASEEEGRTWILRAAQLGQPAAISWLHDDGYSGKLPGPVDTDRTMQLSPVNGTPGKAKVCQTP